MLQHLKDNDPEDEHNIVRMKNRFIFRKHVCIVFELLAINLYDFSQTHEFSMDLVRRFAIQILQSLKYMKEQQVIHCDLKPENVMLKSSDKSGLKVIDLGSSCFRDQIVYTYIQSRYYRAPEIMLGIPYSHEIDMWSFGAILVELVIGQPIFPGEHE